MFKKSIKLFVCICIAAITLNSCIGSFGLFNKVLSWNKTATDNKFLNELIFILISPAYAICGTADLLVLNTIEFWSGDNPIASNVGKTQSVMGSDGRMYSVTTLKDGYEIKDADGKQVNFTFDEQQQTWSVEAEGTKQVLLKMKDNDTAEIMLPNGGTKDISLNEQGMFEARLALGEGSYFAAR
ncbi:MAG: DUF3332 domain-containing protein [Prevotella sp.]|uniref:DUF3332 domain-containing protein n=1 Tax=Prevotella sp. TaxID=59823 RepID=UPI002A2AB1AF|nr:DUF3332 domain-containing protein [Prevotella sp.]MDD7318946.1 DUF3332 domain-containing protein [Prevotellaceae bacterium]MDY4019972.1 DUF3332 domain-containing protein [Prevotella sp.]